MKTTFTITVTDITLDSAYKRALAAAEMATGLVVSRSSVDISPGQRMQNGHILSFEYDFTLELAPKKK